MRASEGRFTCLLVNFCAGPHKIPSTPCTDVRERWLSPSFGLSYVFLFPHFLFPSVTTAAEHVVYLDLLPHSLPPLTQFLEIIFWVVCNEQLPVLLLYFRPSSEYVGIEILILIFICHVLPRDQCFYHHAQGSICNSLHFIFSTFKLELLYGEQLVQECFPQDFVIFWLQVHACDSYALTND